jgi:hypothetical protein
VSEVAITEDLFIGIRENLEAVIWVHSNGIIKLETIPSTLVNQPDLHSVSIKFKSTGQVYNQHIIPTQRC